MPPFLPPRATGRRRGGAVRGAGGGAVLCSSRCAFCSRDVRLKCPLECEVRVSAPGGRGDRRGRRPRRGPRGAPFVQICCKGPDRAGKVIQRGHGGALLLGPLMFRWTTCVRLDHLNAVGPPGSRNTVVQRNASGPTARKWSKQTEGVTTCETPSHHAGRPVGRSRCGTPEPPPPPEPSGSRVLTTRAGRTAPNDRTADPAAPDSPGAPGDDPGGPSRPAPRPSALDNPSYHTRGARSEPLPEQPSQYRLPEIRPDARRITFRGSREEPLIFRAFIRRFSRPGTSLQQIWTRPRPGPPQEPHAHRLRARPFPPLSRSGPADHNS